MVSHRKNNINSKIYKKKHKKFIFLKLWFWATVLIIFFIIYVLYLIIFYSGFQLKNITVSGNNSIKTQDIENVVSEYAVTGLINFWDIKISSRSIFLVNTNRLREGILDKFPVIEGLIINKSFPKTINLNVIERKPIGAFCSSTDGRDDKCFLIDNNGVIFSALGGPASGWEGQKDITIVRQLLNKEEVFVGKQVVEKDIINTIYKIKKNLEDNFQIYIKDVLIASPLRLNVITNENWKIYFDLDVGYNIDSQIIKLNLLLNGGISSNSRENLRYIDLRPKDRAIVCDNPTCGK